MQAALLDFCYAIQIFPKTNPKMWRRRRRWYIPMPVSHSSGLNVLFPLFFRCASPPSTNLSLVLPSLVCLIPPQSCICCLQRVYLLGLITFAFLQQVRVNGGKQRRVFEYLASLGLLFHLYVAGLRPLLSPCHTCIPHTRSAFFYGLWICFACAEESGNFATDFNETEPRLLLWQKVTDTAQRASFGDSKTKPGGQPAIPAAQSTEPHLLCEEAAIRAAMAEVTEVTASGRTSSRGAASLTGGRCLARRRASGFFFNLFL